MHITIPQKILKIIKTSYLSFFILFTIYIFYSLGRYSSKYYPDKNDHFESTQKESPDTYSDVFKRKVRDYIYLKGEDENQVKFYNDGRPMGDRNSGPMAMQVQSNSNSFYHLQRQKEKSRQQLAEINQLGQVEIESTTQGPPDPDLNDLDLDNFFKINQEKNSGSESQSQKFNPFQGREPPNEYYRVVLD